MMNKNFTTFFWLNFVTSSYYIIAYLCLATSLSYILSNSIFVYSLFTGIYLMSMGLGAILVERYNVVTPEKLKTIICFNGVLGLLVINPGVTGLIYANEYLFFLMRQSGDNFLFLTLAVGAVLTIILGFFSGCELPLFSRLIENYDIFDQRLVTRVLTLDYLGTFLGLVLFHFILFPYLGLINTITYTQIVSAIIISLLTLMIDRRNKLMIFLLIFIIFFSIASHYKSEAFNNAINLLSF